MYGLNPNKRRRLSTVMSSQQNARWDRFEEDICDGSSSTSSTSSSMSLNKDRKRKPMPMMLSCPYLPNNTSSKRANASNIFEKTQLELLEVLHSTTSFLGKIDTTHHSRYLTPTNPMITFSHKRPRGEPSKDSVRYLHTSLE